MSTGRDSLTLPSGDEIHYTISERDVQHPRLELDPNGTLSVIVPPGRSGPALISKEKEWIRSELDDQRRQRNEIRRRYGNVEEGFTLWGQSYTLDTQTGPRRIKIDSGRVCVSTPNEESTLVFLEKSLRNALREAVRTIARPFCDQLQTDYETLAIRSQRTKWASCSGGDTLNFNIRCAFLPITHLKYLVGHEVAHLLEPDHDENFWELVETLVSDVETKRYDLQGFWYSLHHNPKWQKLLNV